MPKKDAYMTPVKRGKDPFLLRILKKRPVRFEKSVPWTGKNKREIQLELFGGLPPGIIFGKEENER
jgi:hypothetical protein